MKSTIVIGANYGDEGKGVNTHLQTLQHTSPLVVRFNGGSQAGHTVHLKDGRRHIFSSFGSGSFTGAATFLSKHFLFNPKVASNEAVALRGLKVEPRLIVDPHAEITTPWDIALNQYMELGAGPKKHGSCGMGIGETMARKLSGLSVTAGELRTCIQNEGQSFLLVKKLHEYFKAQVEARGKQGLFEYLTLEHQEGLYLLLKNSAVLSSRFFVGMISLSTFEVKDFETVKKSLKDDAHIVFEGAQGLLLDEEDPDHQPHVTWSKTGVHNAATLCKEHGIEIEKKIYCTRPYLTRHGQGPILAGQEVDFSFGEDRTNRPNEWQGSLRHAHLNWTMLNDRVQADTQQAPGETELSISCWDQLELPYKFLTGTSELTTTELETEEEVLTSIQAQSSVPVKIVNGIRM